MAQYATAFAAQILLMQQRQMNVERNQLVAVVLFALVPIVYAFLVYKPDGPGCIASKRQKLGDLSLKLQEQLNNLKQQQAASITQAGVDATLAQNYIDTIAAGKTFNVPIRRDGQCYWFAQGIHAMAISTRSSEDTTTLFWLGSTRVAQAAELRVVAEQDSIFLQVNGQVVATLPQQFGSVARVKLVIDGKRALFGSDNSAFELEVNVPPPAFAAPLNGTSATIATLAQNGTLRQVFDAI